MGGGEEARLILRWGEVEALFEGAVEVAGKGGCIALFGIRQIEDGTMREIEAEHGADALKGEGLSFDGG